MPATTASGQGLTPQHRTSQGHRAGAMVASTCFSRVGGDNAPRHTQRHYTHSPLCSPHTGSRGYPGRGPRPCNPHQRTSPTPSSPHSCPHVIHPAHLAPRSPALWVCVPSCAFWHSRRSGASAHLPSSIYLESLDDNGQEKRGLCRGRNIVRPRETINMKCKYFDIY